MYLTTEVIAADGGIAVKIPTAIARSMNLGAGDTVTMGPVTEGYVLTLLSPEALRQLEIGRQIMRERRDALRATRRSA